MSWVLHICVVGWLGACNHITNIEYLSEADCQKALAIVERQAKEQKQSYRIVCHPREKK